MVNMHAFKFVLNICNIILILSFHCSFKNCMDMFTNDFIRCMHFVFLLVHLFLTFETEGLKLLVITNKLLVGLIFMIRLEKYA